MATFWLDVLDETIRACAAHGRTDLANELHHRRAQLLDARLRVLVVGAPKQGKSQLVNALLNAPACPVGDDLTTTVPAVVGYADEPSSVPVADPFAHLAVGVPRQLLRAGLVLVDTPPLGRTGPVDALLSTADALILASDAGTGLSAGEVEFLRYAVRRCPTVIVALTKIDLAPRWRQVAERTRVHLAEAGLTAPVLPVSAALRLRAAGTDDLALNAESGFPELVGQLRRELSTKAQRLAPHTAAVLTATAIESLLAPLVAEHSTPPAEHTTAALQLRDLQHRHDGLRRHASRWQSALADDISDLVSDIEYDLRDRTRRVLRTVDEFFDTADPALVWEIGRAHV